MNKRRYSTAQYRWKCYNPWRKITHEAWRHKIAWPYLLYDILNPVPSLQQKIGLSQTPEGGLEAVIILSSSYGFIIADHSIKRMSEEVWDLGIPKMRMLESEVWELFLWEVSASGHFWASLAQVPNHGLEGWW